MRRLGRIFHECWEIEGMIEAFRVASTDWVVFRRECTITIDMVEDTPCFEFLSDMHRV